MENSLNKMTKLLSSILDISQSLSGEEYLKNLIIHIAQNFGVKYVFLGHTIDNKLEKVRTDFVWDNNSFLENFEYSLKDTPCEIVINTERVCSYPSNVCETFPKDQLLQDMQIESYIGSPVLLKNKSQINILVLLDDKPIMDTQIIASIVEFLSLRASSELEKMDIEEFLNDEIKKKTIELELSHKNLELSYKKIEELNKNLEEKVEEEVAKNKQKDLQLFAQSKMASMGDMVGNIAHQWRQPLSAISTLASGVKLKSVYDQLNQEDLHKDMDMIVENTQYLSKTIDTFINFFKEEKEFNYVSIKDIIQKVIAIVESSLNSNFITLSTNFDEFEDFKIYTIPQEIQEVIINILNNAKDALNDAKIVDKKIYIIVSKEDENVVIKIKDNGGGISIGIINRIFEPYFTTKGNKKGTGLGLHMSYRIMTESLNGQIYAQNDSQGAVFTIKLPSSDLQ